MTDPPSAIDFAGGFIDESGAYLGPELESAGSEVADLGASAGHKIVAGAAAAGSFIGSIVPFLPGGHSSNPPTRTSIAAPFEPACYACVGCYYSRICVSPPHPDTCSSACDNPTRPRPTPKADGVRRTRTPHNPGTPSRPQDPCALHHCIVPSGPKHDVTYAAPIDLASIEGAVAVAEEAPSPGSAFPLPQANDDVEVSLLNVLKGSTKTDVLEGEEEGASNGCINGWVKYGARDRANGRRSTGVEACLTQKLLALGGGEPSSNPPGYTWAKDFSEYLGVDSGEFSINRCHLLGKQLGGSGSLYNIATCGRSTNAARQDPTDPGRLGSMVDFENMIRDEVEGGVTVRYSVTPKYLGNRTVPYAFVMTAQNSYGVWQADVVPNVVYSPKRGRWVNIGIESCPVCASKLPKPGVK